MFSKPLSWVLLKSFIFQNSPHEALLLFSQRALKSLIKTVGKVMTVQRRIRAIYVKKNNLKKLLT